MTRCAEIRLRHADADLFATDQGEGPPLLFFHGGLADHRAALRHVGPLAERLRLITPDLRGAGRSRWSGPLSWSLLAQDAVALLDHLGLGRAVVGGVSMGSAVALSVALSAPDRLAGLAVVWPVYPGADRPLAPAVHAAMAAMDAAGQRARTEGMSALRPLLETLPPELRDRARAMFDGFDPASVAATTAFLASDAQPFETLGELGAIRCPTLLVPGADPTHPAEVAALLATHLPQARVLAPEDPGLLDALAALAGAA